MIGWEVMSRVPEGEISQVREEARQFLERYQDRFKQAQVAIETVYSYGGPWKLVQQIVLVSPTEMANDVKEIEYLAKQLEGIMQSVSPHNWDDVADSWFNLAKLYNQLRGDRARAVLQQILSADKLDEKLGVAAALHDIGMPTSPPDRLLQDLKAATASVKENMYLYSKVIARETARINRISQLQARGVGLIGSAVLALFVSIGNLITRYGYDHFAAAGDTEM